jgi:flagellar biosynthesis protein FlhB
MQDIQKYFQRNPRYFGVILIIFGIIAFVSTLFNAKWLFTNTSNTYNLKKMDGWINIFGKKAGRVAGFIISIMIIIAGIMYIILWK